jgi:signal transduction histidine kinase
LLAALETDFLQTVERSGYLLSDFDYGFAVFSPRSKLLAATGDETLWSTLVKDANDELSAARAGGMLPSFLEVRHPTTGDPLMLTMAATPDGETWVAGAFSPSTLAHRVLADVFSPSKGAVTFLVDREGRILYQVGELSSGKSIHDHVGVREALSGTRGATYLMVEGSEHVITYSPVQPIGWALVIEEPWEAVTSPVLRTTENAPLVMVPALVLALVALWFGVRQIVQPLKTLEEKAAELGWGDYEAIEEPVGGIAEIRRLQTELIHLAHKVKAAQQGLRGYIGAMTTGQEEERRRLARELHDDTLQSLIALNQRVQLSRLEANGGTTPKILDEIQTLTTETIQNLRRITRALRPIYLEDLGLVASLEMLARETQNTSGVRVVFNHSNPQRRLDSAEELALYRITQEALSNVVRHAKAKECQVNLRFTPGFVHLTISDNGQGFTVPESPAELAHQGHYGLLGMHERAELIGARLEIESKAGEGTFITVKLPEK